jgi:hypothetical protein
MRRDLTLIGTAGFGPGELVGHGTAGFGDGDGDGDGEIVGQLWRPVGHNRPSIFGAGR